MTAPQSKAPDDNNPAREGAIMFSAARTYRIAILLLSSVAFGATGLVAQTGWNVGLAAVKITPDKPIRMAGYASRDKPSEGVDADLFAKALALEDSDGNRALLITADLLGFTREIAEAICVRLKTSDSIDRKDILLNSSHTHAGPYLSVSRASSFPEAHRARIREYVAGLEDKIVEAAQRALRGLDPAKLSWGWGVAKFVMNRREFTDRGIVLGTNPRGLADRTVPVLRVDTAAGKLRAVVFGAATHCTTLTGRNFRISGDYAGFAQARIEASHPGVQAMFMTGCAGNANPNPRGTLELAKRHGNELGTEVSRVLDSELKPVRGPLRTEFRRVSLPLQKLTRPQVEAMAKDAPSYRRFFTERALALLERGEVLPETYEAPFAVWQFGDDLTLVGYSGETLVEYAVMAEQELGPLNLWVAGYCNEVYGYLPVAKVLEEGGYETRGLYMGVGLFSPSVEKVVMKAITEMARAVGRKIP